MYLERRRRKWYACQEIPDDLRESLGRRRFVQSLDTEDKQEAQRRAPLLEARWLATIEQARKGSPDHAERDAEFWRKLISEAPEGQRELVISTLEDELDAKVHRAAQRAGITDAQDPDYEALPERQEANRVFAIATGTMVRFDSHLDEYIATLTNIPKTVDMKRSTIITFSERFPYVADVQRKDVQRWVNDLAREGKKGKTINRILSEVRGYWKYLTSLEVAPEDALPFAITLPKESAKQAVEGKRKPFDATDMVKLLKAAEEKGDSKLADLIRLGMWTGARIEELCSLKVSKIGKDFITIEDAKTSAGWREVPVHSKLAPTLKRLVSASKDGYVLSGLSKNKYADRSNAIGKRFGRLKKAAGYDKATVFHSIRKTVATLLQNADVKEDVAAGILGHDIPTMTYGLYSGGAALEVKRQALEKISYPGLD